MANAVIVQPEGFETQAWIGGDSRVRAWGAEQAADRVRLSLTKSGLYRVTAQELATASGWDAGIVAAAIATTNLSLTCKDVATPWMARGDTLYFYGEPADSFYAPEAVYWVSFGTGLAMDTQTTTPPLAATTNTYFQETLDYTGNRDVYNHHRYRYTTITNASFVTLSPPISFASTNSFSFVLLDPMPGEWEGAITISYFSEADYEIIDTHRCQVTMGDRILGTNAWSGEQYLSFTLSFSSAHLGNNIARVKFVNQGVLAHTCRFYISSCHITYPRLYRARENTLQCMGGNGSIIAVSGFTTNDVVALDISDPANPALLDGVSVGEEETGSQWSATFPDSGEGCIYHLASLAEGIFSPAVRGAREIDWSFEPIPRFAIILPPEGWQSDIRPVMRLLADHRASRGVAAALIDVEDIYNSFSHGAVDPYAIQRFVQATFPRGLRYMLLAGQGTLDYKHQGLTINDHAVCLIPSLTTVQTYNKRNYDMVVMLDPLLGDADGDSKPDVAVGRLPFSNTNDLMVAVRKTIAYEREQAWKRPLSLGADWDNVWSNSQYYPFHAATDSLANTLIAAGRADINRRYVPDKDSGGVTWANLVSDLQGGIAFFYFIGHTSPSKLGDEGRLWSKNEVNITSNHWEKPTIAVIMGCEPNRWQTMTTTSMMIPYGLGKANTGFVAGVGSTGNVPGSLCEEFSREFFMAETLRPRKYRLGDLFLHGLRRNSGQPLSQLLSLSLAGDPTLEVGSDPGTIILIK